MTVFHDLAYNWLIVTLWPTANVSLICNACEQYL